MFKHPLEHLVRQKVYVFGEHAKDKTVDEMRHGLGRVPALTRPLGQLGELGRGLLGQRLPGLARLQPLLVGQHPF